nr:TMV resistance protein N-like [Malus domestica]
MLGRSLTFSTSTSSSSGAADAVVEDNNDDDDVAIPPLREKYDVFLSFRGEDTRPTFTSHLRAALERKKFETYIDEKLKPGDEIGPTLLKAIKKSRLSVIIFSKNYASSTWCLSELVHILKCRKKKGQMVVPIFYDINPSDVRKQEGSYADAFAQLEKRFKDGMGKVRKWRKALRTAANISGFDNSNKKRTEADLIEKLVEDISTKLKRETSYDLNGLVGIQSRIEQVESLLSNNDSQGVCTVGIWGMGGIGKTTLAQAVFKRLSSKFEACCFLSNVREKAEQTDGVNQLKKTLLEEILNERSIDSTSVRERLSRTKVLIVFDDVSDWRQIKDVAGDNLRYSDGSRIIVTSREWSVLMKAVKERKYIYQVEKFKTDDALRLFQSHAFKDNSPRAEYRELSARVVKYAGGIPLALEVLGSLLFPCVSKDEWEDVLSTLINYPNEEIQNTFRVSYNRLGRNAQDVFLDIACFYKGERIEDVQKMVDFGQMHGGSCAADGIRVLRDRSLISIDSAWKTIEMHDLVQEMGWAIVCEQCIEEPGKRSRLFRAEDVYHVLKNNTGTEKVQAISFNRSIFGPGHNVDRADFKNMYNLRLLRLDSYYTLHMSIDFYKFELTLSLPNSLCYLSWKGCPLKSLPPEFSLENLVELHMPYNRVTQLWDGGQNPINLKVLNLHSSLCLTALPHLSRSPNIEHMDLSGCKSLVEIPQYFKNLNKLTYLDLSMCERLEYLPEMPGNIEFLRLQGSGIKELPSSVWSHEKISSLDITFCEELKELPSNTCKLKVSGAFSLYGCCSLEKVWELPRGIGELDWSRTAIKVLPTSSMERLSCLTRLKLHCCIYLASLPRSICKLKSLEELDLTGCYELKVVPSSIYKLTNIKMLSFSYCRKLRNFTQPTGSVGFLSLEVLDLKYSGILEIPEGFICSTSLRVLKLEGTKIRSIPSSIKQAPQPTGSVGFLSLEVLNLKYSGILEIPEGFICSTLLRALKLEGTKIRSIPSSMKQASQLSCLCLIGCTRLQSLPELPMLSCLQANGCKSLKTVSSSRTAITQCWNRCELLQELLDFSGCPRLGDDARSSIMVDAQLRIMRVATAASKLKEEEDYDESSEPFVIIVCPGSELPNWFVHQNEGASINVTLPANWFREGFLGFALSVVTAKALLFCEYMFTFKTEEGESLEINCVRDVLETEPSENVWVWYTELEYEEGANWSSAFFDRVTKVSVHFQPKTLFDHEVKKCGICLLYAEDAEKLKFDVMSLQEQYEPAASRSGDPEASGSDESEELSGSDESEEASGSDDYEGESGSDEEASDESEEASGSDDYEGESGSDEEASDESEEASGRDK